MLPFVFYECETWCLTLGEEHMFRVFKNKAQRKIFGTSRGQATGGMVKTTS